MTEAGWTRERKLVDELLTFIEQTSGRKIKFSAIANLKTGVIEDPQDRIAAWLKRHLADSYRQGRVAGLRQAGEAYIKYLMNPEYRKSWKTFDEWCRWMAQQAAQDEKGVGEL